MIYQLQFFFFEENVVVEYIIIVISRALQDHYAFLVVKSALLLFMRILKVLNDNSLTQNRKLSTLKHSRAPLTTALWSVTDNSGPMRCSHIDSCT